MRLRGLIALAVVAACGEGAAVPADPLAYAAAQAGVAGNAEAPVPPMCYTATGGVSNPCWACHTRGVGRNTLDDSDLQEAYAFSDTALTNHWTNLFVDRKVEAPEDWGVQRAYDDEAEDKAEGRLPVFQGDPEVGLLNAWGWQLQGYIEDARGALRVQSDEEHRFCMGCHGPIGVTIDQTFAFPRKVPGRDGWRPQDLRGLADRPQVGHDAPELVTCFRRVQGGDETRTNDELLARFVPGGVVDEAERRRAAVGGDRDLAWALAPSRARALALDKAYLAVVRACAGDAAVLPIRR